KPQPLAGQHEIKLAYSAAEVAKATSLSVSYVRELIAKGEIKSFHVGRRRLVNRDSLLEFLQMR
ncbi:MAG: helix-turn-helix domain-containing protein, partial [Phyllobacterium sp.]